MNDYQPRQLSTYALTLFRHNSQIGSETVAVDFWDTAGQERFNSMHPAYYHQAHACIMCFDVTRKQTYKNLPAWYKELRDYRAKIPTICTQIPPANIRHVHARRRLAVALVLTCRRVVF